MTSISLHAQLVIEPLRFWRASSVGSRFYGAAELTAYLERLEDKFGEGSPVPLDPAMRQDLEAVRRVLDSCSGGTEDWHQLTAAEPKSAKVPPAVLAVHTTPPPSPPPPHTHTHPRV